MLILVVAAAIFQLNFVESTPSEETYGSVPFGPLDETIMYVDPRSGKEKVDDIEARRRSILDKNFMRYGRGGSDLVQPSGYDEYDDYVDEFARPTRSQDRNDNFMRFGRGGSNFLRFGRNPLGRRSSNFLRFGREASKVRNRRDLSNFKRGSSDFLRFGRNSQFMRFGRNYGEATPTPTEPRPRNLNEEKRRRDSTLMDKIKALHDTSLMNMLVELDEKLQEANKKCTRLE